MEKDAKRDAENTELKSRVRELEARLAILEQSVTEVNGQPQNDKEVIAEVSAVDISDSVIDQQKDVNTKSIEDKKIGDFIPEEPADVSDTVIAQPKQCKPPQIEEVTTKVNHQGRSLDDMKTDAFLDEEYKKKVSDEIKQRKREKKLQGELIVQESSPAINTSCITDLSTTSTELVTLPEQVVEESIPKESAMSCELKLSSGNKQDTIPSGSTPPKKIPYNLKVEQDLRDELSAYMEGKGSASQSRGMFTSVNLDKIFDIQIPEFSLEAILTGSNKVTSQVIVDLFNIAMKTRRKEILCWYCYYKAYEDRVRDVKSKNELKKSIYCLMG
ncbi:hypothetical protein RhiirC2_871892 [Rhizophagus irregularis]|uniref:Uncharacterized protein n=1 Tax=Rhizophagus irregularis TaxID=588596 RepID=A0A2N1M685_9GLOM|nr:hypothetical protein RhiirC2_871892 [Rhizophagus irregularis]